MPFATAQKVNETTTSIRADGLGESLRALRRHRRVTQHQLATAAAMDVATVRQLETGGGTVAPLLRAMGALNGGFVGQPVEFAVGAWIAAARKAAGLTQSALAALVGVSKPTVVQIEHGQGTGVAAVLEGRQFIGIEKDAEHFQAASQRLAQCRIPYGAEAMKSALRFWT